LELIQQAIKKQYRGGTYNSAQSVTLSSTDTDLANIYYTTDGSTPTTSSATYSGPIAINTEGTTTLKFFGVDTAGNQETVQTQTYVIDTTPLLHQQKQLHQEAVHQQ
jgi:hypothetical protein